MLCSINDFLLANETVSGGFALKRLRLRMQRYYDLIVVLDELNPVLLDRNKRRVEINFSVERVHASIKDAETYITDHDSTIPRTGDVKLIGMSEGIFTTTTVALIVNGALVQHELTRHIGKFTEHAYRIIGSPVFAPTPGTDRILMETGDFILTETSDKILLE